MDIPKKASVFEFGVQRDDEIASDSIAAADQTNQSYIKKAPSDLQIELQLSDLVRMSRIEAQEAIRARAQSVYLGGGRVLVRILGYHKLFLSTDDLGFSSHVMLDGYWESWLTMFFLRNLRPGMTVVDVGANFGYYTVLFAAVVGTSGRVIAIEPVPSTITMLRDSIELNGFTDRTRIIAAVAGAIPSSQAHVLVPPREPKNAAVVAETEGSIAVPCVTLDEVLADLDRVDFVKIDVEGAETNVVAGMRKIIAKHCPAIVLEFNAARYADPRGFLESLLELYGGVKNVSWEGDLEEVGVDTILSERIGQDWILFFGKIAGSNFDGKPNSV